MAPVKKELTVQYFDSVNIIICLLWLGRFRQALPCLILSNYNDIGVKYMSNRVSHVVRSSSILSNY